MDIKVTEIGYVENEIHQRTDNNWGNVISKIILREDFIGGLKGLKDFSHVIIISYLHESKYIKKEHLKRRPRNLASMPLIGIFSQRAKNRPNGIGITTVKISEVCDKYILVEGLDAINSTPILDIKPYYPVYDKKDDAKTPEWVDKLLIDYF